MISVIRAEKLCREFEVPIPEANFMKHMFFRKHRTIKAVDGVSFVVRQGESVGFLGENGAGKSTTIKMLSGVLIPSSGELLVNGQVPSEDRRRHAAEIGVVFGQRSQLWWDLPARDSFVLLKRVFRIDDVAYERSYGMLREILGLDAFAGTPVRQLSLGQKMRAELAAALLHEPRVLFLDEPTVGLDVVAKKAVRELVAQLRNRQRITVILTSHDMVDIEAMCDRVIMISRGRLVMDISLDSFRAEYGGRREMSVDFDAPPPPHQFEGVVSERLTPTRFRYRFQREAWTAQSLHRRLGAIGVIRDFSVVDESMEAVVRSLYLTHRSR